MGYLININMEIEQMRITNRCMACDEWLTDGEFFYDDILAEWNDLCRSCINLSVYDTTIEEEKQIREMLKNETFERVQ